MKKIVLKMVILLLSIFIVTYPTISNSKALPLGNLNEDGKVSIEDASILKSYLTQQIDLTKEQTILADLNQDSNITITDYALLKSVILGLIEQPYLEDTVYEVELEKFDIKNNGIVWENNANGITNAINYAKENGYQEVRFPMGTYVIKAPTPIILNTKDLIINFNDSTLKMQDEPYSSHWCMIDLREPAQNLVIKNGIIQGNRFSEQFDSANPYNEGTIPFSIKGGNHILIENLTIKNSSGYGLTIDTGMTRTKRTEIWASDFESGSISDTGTLEENPDTLRSKKMYPVGYLNGEFEIGYTAGYQGYGSILHQEYTAYFYDKDKNFISMATEKQYIKSTLPTGCEYIKLVIPQTQIKDGSEGSAFITNAKTFRNSTIKNCTFDANSAVGLTIGGGQNFTVEDCTFTRNGIPIDNTPAISAKVAIDLEDGWECMQNITIRNSKFSDNRYDLTSCAGSNLLLEGNTFTNGCNIYARSTNYTITNNTFQGPVEFGVSMGGCVTKNTYTNSSIHTYYQRFGNDTQTPILNMYDETFNNSSVYAQNIDSKKQNQLVKSSTFTTTGNEKVWLKGNYEDCTFLDASIYNSANLKNCKIQTTNMYAQASSQYENCTFETGNIMTNSADEISIFNSKLINTPIEITTWANPCNLTIENSTIINTDAHKTCLRLSAGKAKQILLTKNIISSATDVIQFFDTIYSPPQGKSVITDNTISIPEDCYVINGNKIASGTYQIECRNNQLSTGALLHPIYQNSTNLNLLVEEPNNRIEHSLSNINILPTSYETTPKEPTLFSISNIENNIPSFNTVLEKSNQVLKPKEEFEVIVKLEKFQNIQNGLLALNGQLHYDTSILELLHIEGVNDWIFDENSINKDNLKFIIDSNQYTLKQTPILKISFKVNTSATVPNDTTLSLNHIVASNGITDIPSNDTDINITIQAEETQNPIVPPENDNQEDKNDNQSNDLNNTGNNNHSNHENNNQDNTLNHDNNQNNEINKDTILNNTISNVITSDEKNTFDHSIATTPLPRTGTNNTIFILLLLSVIVSIGCFIRIKQLKSK